METLWSFKGRQDIRAAPYYASFDMFYASGKDRPIHLFHEIVMHIDLVVEWQVRKSYAQIIDAFYVFIYCWFV